MNCKTLAFLASLSGSTFAQSALAESAALDATAKLDAGASGCVETYPAPVVTLSTPSRYQDESENRDDLNPEADAAANAILAPLDDFIRAVVADANEIADTAPEDLTPADRIRIECTAAALQSWAAAEALSDLQTPTARLTLGSRLAGLAMAMRQHKPYLLEHQHWPQIRAWFTMRLSEEAAFWASGEAPSRAAENNLRGWSALALVAGGDLLDRDDFMGYGAGLTERLICSADEDGAYPMEMLRGSFALHYHLHMLSALAPAAALVETHQSLPPISQACRGKLRQSVSFALDELENGGQATQERTGQTQSYFDGTNTLGPHHLAWLVAYLTTQEDPKAAEILAQLPWVANSKLGGNQKTVW